MKRSMVITAISLAAAGAGFIAGFLATLALGGLGAAEWVPIGQITGAGLGAGIAVGTAARVQPRTAILLAVTGSITGLALGFTVRAVGDLEWAIAAALVIAVGLALSARGLADA